MKFDLEVDAIGLKCPLPILYCKRGLNSISNNQTLKIKTTDKSAYKDFKSFCEKTGHQLVEHFFHLLKLLMPNSQILKEN